MSLHVRSEEQTAGPVAAFVSRMRKPGPAVAALLILLTAGLLVYAETMAFVWDEGFHLIAAQLINLGKKPYIDFCFPQTLLNAYFNAAVLRVFGHSWRVLHVFDALFVAAAVALTTDFVWRRLPIRSWRFPCAVVAMCFLGLDVVVVQFGVVAQAYGSGLFLIVAAFRFAVRAIETESLWPALLAAMCAGAAAGSTLLTAPALPVLLVWIFLENRAGNRWMKAAIFLAGGIIPFAPEIALFLEAPRQTLFNVVQYQALFRRVNWGDANSHDVDVLTDWLASAQPLLLGLLAAGGLAFIRKRSGWTRQERAPFYLAGWLAVVLGVYIAIAHPTFGRYFVFVIPFAAILACVGFHAAASRLFSHDRPALALAVLAAIIALTLGKALFSDRDATNWYDYEAIAAKVDKVTPRGSEFLADELVYFLLKRTPPPGFEFSYSHKLSLPRDQEALYHVVSQDEVGKMIRSGVFYTVESCKDDFITDMHLEKLFPHQKDVTDDCTVFWGKVKK
ncbi:MAG: hypothetical protein JO270_24145 [Acidobacteriaceae bacterium]|nr:hypothetical protein [Acidobacteriaceae bacterium]